MKFESALPDVLRPPRHRWQPVFWFGLLACGITWSAWIPDALARFDLLHYPISNVAHSVALWGPAIAAVIVSAFDEGIAGLQHLAATMLPRGPFRWYAFAFMAPLVTLGFALRIAPIPEGAFPSSHTWFLALQQTFILTPLFLREELGWRGFLLPRLMRSQSPLVATVCTTLLWVLWHVPVYVASSSIPYALLVLAAVFPISVLFSLIFLRTDSIAPCMLFHSAIDCGSAVLLFVPLEHNYAPAFAGWACILWLMAIPAIIALAVRRRATGPGFRPIS